MQTFQFLMRGFILGIMAISGASGATENAPTLSVVSDIYDEGAVESGPFSAKVLRAEGQEDRLVVVYNGSRSPYDPIEVVGVLINGRWIGEYRGFGQSARGDWYMILSPISLIGVEDGLLELYARKRSGEYDSDFGLNYKFRLQR